MHSKDSAAPVPDRRIPSHPRPSHFANSVCKSRAERPRVPTIRTHCGQFAADLPENCGLSQCPVPTGTGHVPGADTPRHSMCTLFCGSQDPHHGEAPVAENRIAVVPRRPPRLMLHVAVGRSPPAPGRSCPRRRIADAGLIGAVAAPRARQRGVSETPGCARLAAEMEPPASAGCQSPACLRVPACSAVHPRTHGRALLAPSLLPPARCIV